MSNKSEGNMGKSIYMHIHTNNAMDQAFDLIEEDVNEDVLYTNEDQHESSEDEPTEAPAKGESTPTPFEESYEIRRPVWDWEKIADWQVRIAAYTPD